MSCEVPFPPLPLVFYCRFQVKIWHIIINIFCKWASQISQLNPFSSKPKGSSNRISISDLINPRVSKTRKVTCRREVRATVSRPFHGKARIGCSDLWTKGKYFTPWNTNSIGFKTIQNQQLQGLWVTYFSSSGSAISPTGPRLAQSLFLSMFCCPSPPWMDGLVREVHWCPCWTCRTMP